MIEREFVNQKTKEFYIKKYIENKLKRVGISQVRLKKIPLGEKIIIDTGRPGLVVGSKGANIKELTIILKKKFKLENPQIEINEVKDIFLNPHVVAERIASTLERFGPTRFKGIGHKAMGNIMNSGALGVEIIISGKLPGARARNWRFYQGYLKKCGDISIVGVRKAQSVALLKSGIVGIKVAIMPSDLELPDNITILDEPVQVVEEIKEEKPKKAKKKKTRKKKTKKKVKKEVKAVVKKSAKEKVAEITTESKDSPKVTEEEVSKDVEKVEEKKKAEKSEAVENAEKVVKELIEDAPVEKPEGVGEAVQEEIKEELTEVVEETAEEKKKDSVQKAETPEKKEVIEEKPEIKPTPELSEEKVKKEVVENVEKVERVEDQNEEEKK